MVDKVTTGTYNFVSFIWNVALVGVPFAGLAGLAPWAALAVYVVTSVKTQFSDQVKVRDTLQLIKGMSRLLQNCLNILMEQQFQDFF